MSSSAVPLRFLRAVILAWAVAALPAVAADMNKVVRDVFPVAETGFDPAAVHDLYSGTIVQAIFETLYTYDYLARPAKVVTTIVTHPVDTTRGISPVRRSRDSPPGRRALVVATAAISATAFSSNPFRLI